MKNLILIWSLLVASISAFAQDGYISLQECNNDTLEYVPRGARKEYSKVGLLGQLVVQDDGTCEVNGYCTASVNGVATKSDSGYRVIKRIDETHIKIILK